MSKISKCKYQISLMFFCAPEPSVCATELQIAATVQAELWKWEGCVTLFSAEALLDVWITGAAGCVCYCLLPMEKQCRAGTVAAICPSVHEIVYFLPKDSACI